MATQITPVKVTQTGSDVTTPVAADLANGNSVANVSGIQVTVDNSAGASDITVTFVTSATVEGYAVADVTATVPANKKRVFGRFSRTLYGDTVEFTCSATCNLTATY